MSRAGFEYVLDKHVRAAATSCPSLAGRSISPHQLRHSRPHHASGYRRHARWRCGWGTPTFAPPRFTCASIPPKSWRPSKPYYPRTPPRPIQVARRAHRFPSGAGIMRRDPGPRYNGHVTPHYPRHRIRELMRCALARVPGTPPHVPRLRTSSAARAVEVAPLHAVAAFGVGRPLCAPASCPSSTPAMRILPFLAFGPERWPALLAAASCIRYNQLHAACADGRGLLIKVTRAGYKESTLRAFKVIVPEPVVNEVVAQGSGHASSELIATNIAARASRYGRPRESRGTTLSRPSIAPEPSTAWGPTTDG